MTSRPADGTARLAAELDWLSLACDGTFGSADGIELAGADMVKQAAIASVGHGDAEGIERFFDRLTDQLGARAGAVRCELQLARRRPSPADCVVPAWWLAMLVLEASRLSSADTAARPPIVFLLQPMTTKWQLVVTEFGESVAQAAHRMSTLLPGILERVSGAHGCQGGRWGSLIYLRFAVELRPPVLAMPLPRVRLEPPAPLFNRLDEAASTARRDRRAS